MAIELSDNIQANAPKPLDDRFGPWPSVEDALAGIEPDRRYRGLMAGIDNIGLFWFNGGIADKDLVFFLDIPLQLSQEQVVILSSLASRWYTPDPANIQSLKGYATLEDAADENYDSSLYIEAQFGGQTNVTRDFALGEVVLRGKGQIISIAEDVTVTFGGNVHLEDVRFYASSISANIGHPQSIRNGFLGGRFSFTAANQQCYAYDSNIDGAVFSGPGTLYLYGNTVFSDVNIGAARAAGVTVKDWRPETLAQQQGPMDSYLCIVNTGQDGSFKQGPLVSNSFHITPFTFVATDASHCWDAANNWYTVPTSGLYNITTKLRVQDGTIAGHSYAQGPHISLSDGPQMLWFQTNGSRHGSFNEWTAVLVAGQQVRLAYFLDGFQSPYYTAEMVIRRIG